MIRIGLDSGLLGALACFSEESGEWEIYAMPLSADGLIDGLKLFQILSSYNPMVTCVSLESINVAFSGQKKNQANKVTQMTEYGVIHGVLRACGLSYQLVSPLAWQNSAGKKDLDSKEESIVRCIELYPETQKLILKDGSKTTYSDGKAEAVLIVHDQIVRPRKKAKSSGAKK